MTVSNCELRFARSEMGSSELDFGEHLRVLFVARGSAEISPLTDKRPRSLAMGEAALEAEAVRVIANEEGTVVLFWELGSPHDSAPYAEMREPVDLDVNGEYLIRCDRVDFPPGGEALLHTHQGPGIRCLLKGGLSVAVAGHTKDLKPLDPWFESGPEPVYASASENEPTAFVRVMVLPAALLGESSIRYVREEDRAKPKSQRYTVYLDEPIALPDCLHTP